MQCATHPNVETELGCSRCGKPICGRCLVHTPVGARCAECANVRRLPTYNLGRATYARAISAAIAVGAAAGFIWFLFNALTFSFGLFAIVIFGLAIGYAVGEGVAIAANRRAGPPLQIVAAAGVVLAYIVRGALLIAVDGWTIAHFRVLDAAALLAVVAAAWIAAQRVR
jgi:hypothetical protein